MDVRALGYLGIDVADTGAWEAYATTLGTMVVPDGDGGLHLRIDERPHRIVLRAADGSEGLAFAGWEVSDAAALDRAAAELEAAGFAAKPGTDEECAARRVRGLRHTTDPGGFSLELFHGPSIDPEPFVSPTGISRFVTGDMGLGHIVLGTPNHAESVAFYTDVLGFRVSDYMPAGDRDVVFTHCNPRHHSLALVAAPEAELYHFMLEVGTVDDVGATLDRHESEGVPVSMSLGRHMNDRMLSFYSRSPSGFDVEFGCGGIRIDDATWIVGQIPQPSFWGHRRIAGA